MNRLTTTNTILAAAAAISLTACGAITKVSASAKPDAGYQAVFLDSGQVFFGHLQGLGTEYPVMSDAFYVQTVSNTETKQTTNVLVKRGREWHQPDRMTLNSHHILYVEPVAESSQVAKLIAQAKS